MSFCGGVAGWGEVCTAIFVSNTTTVLRLCCVVIGVVTMNSWNGFLVQNVWYIVIYNIYKLYLNGKVDVNVHF